MRQHKKQKFFFFSSQLPLIRQYSAPPRSECSNQLVHPPNESIDQLFPVPMISPLDKVPSLLAESPTSTAQLEWPEEVVGFLEVRPNSEDFMDQVLHANNPIFPQSLRNARESTISAKKKGHLQPILESE